MAIACALLAVGAAQAQDRLRAKAVAYGSGTAFSVLDGNEKLKRIKLAGVDAPERKQRFAAESRQLASQWLGAQPLDIEINGTDQDARVIGRVIVDGRDVALILIEAGLAWCDPSDDARLPEQTRTAYRTACDQAKAQHRGLWQDAHPIPPWEHRKLPEFDQPPPRLAAERNCREVGHQTVQCDDGKSYRVVGDNIIGSDGVTYSRQGRTYTGSDGSRFTQQGSTAYGSDGTVCRSRGRQTSCY